jgi:two-component system, cell cycle sensor histidine kinase and response regulator CckA
MPDNPVRPAPDVPDRKDQLSPAGALEVVNTAPVGLLLYQDGRIVYSNATAERLLDYSNSELLALTAEQVQDIIWDADRAAVQAAMEKLNRGEIVPPVTHRVRTTDGSPRWVEGSVSRLTIDGLPTTRVLFFDVSDHKAVERNLQESESLLSSIAASAADSIFCKSVELRYTFVNAAMCQLLGCAEEDLIGKQPEEVFGPEDGKTVREVDMRCLAGEKVSATRTLNIGGVEHTFHTIQVSMRDSEGKAIGITGIVRDVTADTTAKRELAESQERYRQLVEASPNGIAVHADGKVVFVNSEAVRLLGASGPEEILGQSFLNFAHPDDYSLAKKRAAASYSGDSPGPGVETRMIRVDGTSFWVEAASGPVTQDGRPASQVVFRDATARKEAEAANALLEQQLLQAQKLEAVGRLAGGVAHDFNNLLTEISGNAALALMDLHPGNDVHKAFSAIQDASRRAAALTRQLLAFSRKQVFQPTLVDLDGLVLNMEDMLRRLLGADVFLKTSLHTRGAYLMADPGQLEQVLLNLCINARDAMPDGGNITISAHSTDADAGLRAQCPEPAGVAYLRLSVSDSGLGMDEETLTHIFEPFFTTKPQDKGTGLGLSTTYGIVQQHGGEIVVESKPDHGSVFHLWLPVTSGTPIKPQSLHGETLLMGSELILYVEDEPVVREVTTAILERLGYRVLAAAAPREALAVLEAQDPYPDLLLSDVILPEMNGRELSEVAVKIAPDMKVLLTSGYSQNIISTDANGVAPNFIGKPSTPRALSMKLREVLDGE